MSVPSAILELADEAAAIRRDLHMHPELAFEETRTSGIVAARLDEYGCEVHRGLARTGVVGVLRNGSSPRAIGLRAEMDALPIDEANGFPHASKHAGRMHACGHDGHVAMLLGAARYLAATRNFEGTVHFIFQPAEEVGGGGRLMVEEGLFERFSCDAVFALHNRSGLPVGHMAATPGPILASEDNFEITVVARGSHAAQPHLGIDPFVIGSQIVMALHTVRARNVDPVESALVSVGFMRAGRVHNVIPDELVIGGTVRALSAGVQDLVEHRIREIAVGTAAAFGAHAEVTYRRDYPPTVNHEAETEFAAAAAADVCGAGRLHRGAKPSMGAEDFSFMLQARPGAMLWLGNGAGRDTRIPHSPHYDFDDAAIPTGIGFFVRLVQRFLAPA